MYILALVSIILSIISIIINTCFIIYMFCSINQKFNIKHVNIESNIPQNVDNMTKISEDISNDLIEYCKEKYNIDAFTTTETDQISLAYKKGDETKIIIQLKFPLTQKGTSEYNSTLEYQKEEIDEWRNKNC